ncbi:MAG: ATP-binding protein [Planctomycetaceae bacterium]|jgi:serine/threonine-protein kinase RsbW|nr:ATP-binding protein [Planctomycetaceae bacterium]
MNAQAWKFADTLIWKWSNSCSFASDMATAHRLIDEVMTQIENMEWSSKEKFAINMALEEALVNAVQHGNNSDPNKNVHFTCNLNDNLLYVKIEDEGPGFDPDAIPDPTDEEHILDNHGRGVLLIRSFVTNVRWNDKGNLIEFEKERAVG